MSKQQLDDFVTALYRAQLRVELIYLMQQIEYFGDNDE